MPDLSQHAEGLLLTLSGTAWHAANPKFSLRQAIFKGHPVVENLERRSVYPHVGRPLSIRAAQSGDAVHALTFFETSEIERRRRRIFMPRVIENQGGASVFERMAR